MFHDYVVVCTVSLFLPVNYTVKNLKRATRLGGEEEEFCNYGITEQPLSSSEVTLRNWTTPDDQPNRGAKRFSSKKCPQGIQK